MNPNESPDQADPMATDDTSFKRGLAQPMSQQEALDGVSLTASNFNRINPNAIQKDQLTASSFQPWEYDVYICFRGRDTCRNFVYHLYESLERRGIQTAKENVILSRGERIGPALLKAIRKSRIAIIVFSENFADSRWCLDELEYIMKCMDESWQIVFPIFYGVDPSEVRKQKGKYGEAFVKHKYVNDNKVESWREALVRAGSLSGWVLKDFENRDESKVIKLITSKVQDILVSFILNASEDLVGIDTHLQDMKSKLEMWSPDQADPMATDDTSFKRGLAQPMSQQEALDGVSLTASNFNRINPNAIQKDQLTASSFQPWEYDVFICFRGRDTCRNFVDHLYESLERRGIQTAKDNVILSRGERIGPALLKAIRKSRIAIIVFSENFADSRWCLDELEYIMKCMDESWQIVFPIFYGVDPSEVRKQKGKYGEAFVKHKYVNDNKVESWREALVRAGSLSGWVLKDFENRDESKVIKLITSKVQDILVSFILNASEDLVGIDTHLQDMKSKLEMWSGGCDVIHNISLLDDDEAIELFHKHAFRDCNRRKKDYELLSKGVVSYASGLPLALKILGTILCDKDMIVWESALARLEKLKFSYDGLTPVELANELQYSYLENYRVLRSNGSLQKILWNNKYLLHLICLILSDMHGIATTPEFDELPHLQELTLHYCSSLEEIHPSLGHHPGLTYLSVSCCHKLRMIPTIAGMKKLKTLEILDCDALHEFPEVHAIIDRHWSILTTETIAEFSRGSSSWTSSYSIPAVYSQWRNHDVFLSFIGEYDSKMFVDNLYSAFVQQGIHTYKPDETPSTGDSTGLSIKNAIEESQIVIIIFTTNYAGSSQCLDELSYIMKCIDTRGLNVMPIFYDVSSSDVQKQSGAFGKEFDKQESENMAKVESWRKALSGVCKHSGWSLKHIANRNESRYIKDIVATVSHRLFFLNSKVKKDLIGIGPRLKSLTSELAIGSDDVRIVVVGGIGGSGKTTIASCVYMEISRQFEGRCFVENVRDESSKYGIKKLQQKLLSTILKKEVDVPSDEEGKHMLQSMLCHRKVLIVLDDVNDPHQLELLAGSHEWFGEGSRIIITSREGNVLLSKVDVLYDVSLLSNDEAIKLFRRHAYPEYNLVDEGKWRPSSSFVEAYDMLSQNVISYAYGLPLTLKVLGSFLYEKDKDEWEGTLAKLRDVSNPSIIYKLKISYDGLQPDEKELFLDIACFFRGAFVDSLRTLLNAFNFHPFKRVNVLVKRGLISITNGMFDMHDLIEEMAHHIVKEGHPTHPQKHSRVWQWIDVADICATDTTEEFNKIQALYAPNYDAPSNLLKVVANMKNLQLLSVRQHVKEVVEEPLFLSNELRWISWENYPARSFPASFQPELLFSLILRNGLQRVLWKGFKRLPRLKVLDLHGSKNLDTTPDFGGLPNLERLTLSGCSSLKEIDRSIGYHERLVYLNLDSCEKLETFPPILWMPKLETLILSRCFQLLKFPKIKNTMYGLQHLNMEYSGIEVLPSTVGQYCIKLVSINLISCDKLERIEGNFKLFKQRCVILVDAHNMKN